MTQNQTTPKIFDIARPEVALPVAEVVAGITAASGLSAMAIMKDFWGLSQGPGKLSINDYVKYRLFDKSFYGDADRKAFLGQRTNHALMLQVNYRHDWFALLNNKVAFQGYMAGYGLPVIATTGLYAPGFAGSGNVRLLADRAAVTAFLLTPDLYPMFGKPVEGAQSLGSLALAACDAKAGTVTAVGGDVLAADAVAEAIAANFPDGFMFQPLHGSPADLAKSIGPRLSTVRVLTLLTDDGPQVLKAVWKIPAAGNIADNYWRPGNLLAALDADSGAVRSVSCGIGVDYRAVTQHSDTGAELIGLVVPGWEAVRGCALEGARALKPFALLGWDIGLTEGGAVIVEANEAPDLTLVQVAERAGANTPLIQDLLRRRKAEAAAYEAKIKAELKAL
jgi:hypothetical protein